MKGARSLSNSLFSLLSIAGAVLLFTATIAPASANSGDWSLVSAPPPPGPYRTVNLDPRVPGQEGSPAIGNAPRFLRPPENIVPDIKAAAPAAGGQANYQTPVNQLPLLVIATAPTGSFTCDRLSFVVPDEWFCFQEVGTFLLGNSHKSER